jgi:serine protease Do
MVRTFGFLLVSAVLPAFVLPIAAARGQEESTERSQLYEELDAEAAALAAQGRILKKVVRVSKPTVVHIEAKKASQVSYSRRTREEAGSGVVVELNNRRYILTNRHVIDSAPLEDIEVRLADGRLTHPRTVWADPRTDIAVMALPISGLTAARIGDSDKVEIGDFVLAVGSPFGLSHSVTYGIISAMGRRDLQLGDGSIRYQDFMQTDAAINPGNSGGPLLNMRGEVIGINTAIASSSGGSEGIGFTIPINMAVTVARQLVVHGHTVRAYLGVRLDDNFGADAAADLGLTQPHGALISSVTPNTPAERARLKSMDVVLEFDGYRIEDDEHLIKVVGFTPVGKEVELVVLRQGKKIRLSVTVEDRSKFESDG